LVGGEAGEEVPCFSNHNSMTVFSLPIDSQQDSATGKTQSLTDILGVERIAPKKTSLDASPFFARVVAKAVCNASNLNSA